MRLTRRGQGGREYGEEESKDAGQEAVGDKDLDVDEC
jgi:hypothetical protein